MNIKQKDWIIPTKNGAGARQVSIIKIDSLNKFSGIETHDGSWIGKSFVQDYRLATEEEIFVTNMKEGDVFAIAGKKYTLIKKQRFNNYYFAFFDRKDSDILFMEFVELVEMIKEGTHV